MERCVTFHEPELELFSGRGLHQKPRGYLPQAQMRRGEEGLLSTRRTEVPHPQEIPMAYQDIENRIGYLPEPSIGNYEVWLNWQACQLDTPPWWRELVAIPEVEDPKRLAQKIWASFLFLTVRCETFLNQEYTMPSAPNVSPGAGSFLVTLPIRMSGYN